MERVVAGRQAELGLLDDLLADPLSEPRSVVIDGAPGIGKTTLLRALLDAAGSQGYAVAVCQPTRAERELSYAGLVSLLGDLGMDAVSSLPGPQARVLRTIARLEETAEPIDRLSLYLATAAVVREVSGARPLLLAVDDAQWLDQPTARTLSYVVRRLSGTATRLAIVRSVGATGLLGEPSEDDTVDWTVELPRAMPDGRHATIELGPMGPTDLSRILRRVLGWAPAWPRVVRIAALSQGNPLHALELARAFGAVRSGTALEGPLPDSVLELARSRIAGLPEGVRDAVGLASVPRDASVDLLSRLDPRSSGLRDSLEEAVRRGS